MERVRYDVSHRGVAEVEFVEKEVCGVRVHYELAGAGEKRIVLLHGWGCDAKLMAPVAAGLQDGARVLSLDFPAHGASGRPPEPWGVPEFAACVRELLAQESFLPCAVVAHSFGGRVTLWLASQYPEMFTRIVLTGAAGIPNRPTEKSKKRAATYKKLRSICEGMKQAKIFGSLPDKAEDALRKKYGSRDYNALDAEMRKTFVKVINQDLTPCLSKIKQPTLLLWGDADTETPLWMGQEMEKAIPDAALIPLEGGTHFAYLEQSARFNAIIRNFLLGA